MEKKSLCSRKRKRGECESNENADQKTDRISDLPDHIIHQVFSLLPTKAAATTSVMSKKLHWAWLSCPNLDFDQGDFKVKSTSKDLESRKEEARVQRKKFIEHVVNSLRRVCDQKLNIQKFKLKMSLCYYFRKSHWIDKWIKLATESHVEDLVLDFEISRRNRWYKLPQEIFACESITVLQLHNCELKLPLSKRSIRFHSLQRLSLEEVRVNGCNLDDLIASCPSIEQVSLRNCKNLKVLSVRGLLKLETFEFSTFSQDAELDSLDIEAASSLQFLHLSIGRNLTTVINVAECTKLKVLTLSGTSTTVVNVAGCRGLKTLYLQGEIVTDRLFHDLMSEFPILETLQICACNMLQGIKFSSEHLKILNVLCCNLEVMEIDAPHLCTFEYVGEGLPSSSVNASCQWKAHLQYFYGRPKRRTLVNTSWYLRLKGFLDQANNIEALTISFPYTANITSTFNPKEISQDLFPSFCELEHLRLRIEIKTRIDASKPSYAALMDGLFWSCHPKAVSLVSGTTSHNNFIKFVCKNLLNNERPNCCNSSHIKCWRHYLEDSNIEGVEMVEERHSGLWISETNSWKIPQVLLEERPLRWKTLLHALPKLGVAYIRIALKWRSLE